jgi:uncharacterized protein (DUF983 family)
MALSLKPPVFPNTDMKSILTLGTVGVTSTALAVSVSFTSHVESWLRLISLLVGIAVGVATLISLLKKLKGK